MECLRSHKEIVEQHLSTVAAKHDTSLNEVLMDWRSCEDNSKKKVALYEMYYQCGFVAQNYLTEKLTYYTIINRLKPSKKS